MLSPEQLKIMGVKAPPEYIRAYEVEMKDLEPWNWITDEEFDFRVAGLKDRYPERNLVPFAERQDCDDVACWDLEAPGIVIVIHDYASKGYETRANFGSFRDWLHQAMDDCLDFI
jgi:hypothetical protein